MVVVQVLQAHQLHILLVVAAVQALLDLHQVLPVQLHLVEMVCNLSFLVLQHQHNQLVTQHLEHQVLAVDILVVEEQDLLLELLQLVVTVVVQMVETLLGQIMDQVMTPRWQLVAAGQEHLEIHSKVEMVEVEYVL